MLRSIAAVFAGYAIFAVSAVALFQLSGQQPHEEAPVQFMVVAAMYGAAFALLGGYVGALIAGRMPLTHGAAVAAILAFGASVSLIGTLGHGAIWSQVCALAFMAPAAVAGGWLRGRTVRTA